MEIILGIFVAIMGYFGWEFWQMKKDNIALRRKHDQEITQEIEVKANAEVDAVPSNLLAKYADKLLSRKR